MNNILIPIGFALLCMSCTSGETKSTVSAETDTIVGAVAHIIDTVPSGARIVMQVYADKVKGYAEGMHIIDNGDAIL
jgi:hypothetical protein